MVSACAVKRQAFHHVEIVTDSTHSSEDTSWHSREVTFAIEHEEASGNNEVTYSEEAFNRYLDSLFALIDTTCDRELISKTIFKTKGLWNSDTSFLETTYSESFAVVQSGKLHHRLFQKDTTIRQKFDSLLQVITKEREVWHNREVKETSESVSRSGFSFKWILISVILMVILWAGIKRLL